MTTNTGETAMAADFSKALAAAREALAYYEGLAECNADYDFCAHEITGKLSDLLAALDAARGQAVAWVDEFGNAYPLSAYSGKGDWQDDHKRHWRRAYLAPVAPAAAVPATAAECDFIGSFLDLFEDSEPNALIAKRALAKIKAALAQQPAALAVPEPPEGWPVGPAARAMWAAAQQPAAAVSVTDAMVERALKVLAFEHDGATFPNAYSFEEVKAERATMRKVLAAAAALTEKAK